MTENEIESLRAEAQKWKELADDFASSITVSAGNGKPRINVDIEKFLFAQHRYKEETNAIQPEI